MRMMLCILISLLSGLFCYRIGYCNGVDSRINASECKPMRKICLFESKL